MQINSSAGFRIEPFREFRYPSHSAVAAHCLQHGYEYGKKKLLKKVTDWKTLKLNAWESFYLNSLEGTLNLEEPLINSHLFKSAQSK
jgi:hypothetical protein